MQCEKRNVYDPNGIFRQGSGIDRIKGWNAGDTVWLVANEGRRLPVREAVSPADIRSGEVSVLLLARLLRRSFIRVRDGEKLRGTSRGCATGKWRMVA